MKVLIVDDEADMRRLIRYTLGPLCEVYEASSGREALRIARRVKPRLMLLDIGMPQVDGHAVLRAAREFDPSLCVIMLTADHSIDTARSALQCGALSYITKPFDPDALISEVDRIMERSSVHRHVSSVLPWRVAGA